MLSGLNIIDGCDVEIGDFDATGVAITDFGLATTDKLSDEFRTGSVYHMSPGTSYHLLLHPS